MFDLNLIQNDFLYRYRESTDELAFYYKKLKIYYFSYIFSLAAQIINSDMHSTLIRRVYQNTF